MEDERTGIAKTDVTRTDDDGTVRLCLEQGGRPVTPDHLKKYRRSNLYEPGKPYVHWGAADNPRDKGLVYGKVQPKDAKFDTAGAALKPSPLTAIAQWELQQKEAIYASTQREPLGRAMVRGHVLPEGLGTQVPFPGGAVFDARQHDREGEVKALLFPKDLNYQESKEMHEQYIRTHGRYDPGEQRTRGYDWDGIGLNPAETVFGKKAATDPLGAKIAINPNLDPSKLSETIVSARLAAFKLNNDEPLGKPRNRTGPLPPTVPADFRFGAVHRSHDGGTKAALTGTFTREQLLDTGDLGKVTRRRGQPAPAADPSRIYGVPSIRTDIHPPQKRSVADHRAFGDEPSTASLIAPPAGAAQGVFEKDFMQAFNLEDMRGFYQACGMGDDVPENIFQLIFEKAAEVDGRPDGLATLNTFQQVKLHVETRQI